MIVWLALSFAVACGALAANSYVQVNSKEIFHIISKTDWQLAKKEGAHRPESLKTAGFIHCSPVNEIAGSANAYFKGQKDLIVLRIETNKLKAPVKFERASNRKSLFPHIYGPLNIDAVTAEYDLPSLPDGSFRLPQELLPSTPNVRKD